MCHHLFKSFVDPILVYARGFFSGHSFIFILIPNSRNGTENGKSRFYETAKLRKCVSEELYQGIYQGFILYVSSAKYASVLLHSSFKHIHPMRPMCPLLL